MVIYATGASIYTKRVIIRDMYVASWWRVDCFLAPFGKIEGTKRTYTPDRVSFEMNRRCPVNFFSIFHRFGAIIFAGYLVYKAV